MDKPSTCLNRHSSGGLSVLDVTTEERKPALKQIFSSFNAKLADKTSLHFGYPFNLDFDFPELDNLVNISLNNLGDPYITSNYGIHSREFELGVLAWFAQLWELPLEESWGYCTTGGTEGNLHGLLVGREVFPTGKLFASKDSHYSVFKAARMYRMDVEAVASQPNGEIDYGALADALSRNGLTRPAILNLNIGSTVKGAVDDIDRVLTILARCGYAPDRFYIHCDGALFGSMLPFVDAPGRGWGDGKISFQKPIGSVCISGHKFLGAPSPCGVTMTRMCHAMKLSTDIEYLNSRDATITGSRNGSSPVFMWHRLSIKGLTGLRADVDHCISLAQLVFEQMVSAGVVALLNPLSCTVVFERPLEEAFVLKWQLACEGDICHCILMPNHTAERSRAFVAAYLQSREAHGSAPATAIAGALSFNSPPSPVTVLTGSSSCVLLRCHSA